MEYPVFGSLPSTSGTRFNVSPTAVSVTIAFVNACPPMAPLEGNVKVEVSVAAFAGNVSRPTNAKHSTILQIQCANVWWEVLETVGGTIAAILQAKSHLRTGFIRGNENQRGRMIRMV
jgi:hypothetical protein